MRRALRNFLCIVSAALFLSGMFAWCARGYVSGRIQRWNYRLDTSHQPARQEMFFYEIWCADGAITFSRSRDNSPPFGAAPRPGGHWASELSTPPRNHGPLTTPYDRTNLRFAGFQMRTMDAKSADRWWTAQELRLPLWSFLFFGIPPLLWWRQRRRQRFRGFPVASAERNDDSILTGSEKDPHS
jgi:hypothetical protein